MAATSSSAQSATTRQVLGIDIGGSGMKAAPVDVESGELLAERFRIPTPHPATPDAMAAVVVELADHFDWEGPVGCAYPGVVQQNVVRTAANLDASWVGVNASTTFAQALGCDPKLVNAVNDADAAGIAEVEHGAGSGRNGSVLLITLGTGIGTALFADGQLVPNTELGHIFIDGADAEETASARAREEAGQKWVEWAPALNRYLHEIHRLIWPDLIILGGGVSSKFHKFSDGLDVETEVVPATLRNQAGIVGAAMAQVRGLG